MDMHGGLQITSLKPMTWYQTKKFAPQKKRVKDWLLLRKRLRTNCSIKHYKKKKSAEKKSAECPYRNSQNAGE